MPTRKLWVTEEPWPTTQETINQAEASGATEIVHGIPPSLTGLIPMNHVGYFELTIPDPDPEPSLENIFSALPVETLPETNEILLSLKNALEQKGVI